MKRSLYSPFAASAEQVGCDMQLAILCSYKVCSFFLLYIYIYIFIGFSLWWVHDLPQWAVTVLHLLIYITQYIKRKNINMNIENFFFTYLYLQHSSGVHSLYFLNYIIQNINNQNIWISWVLLSIFNKYSSSALAAALTLPSSFPCLQYQEPNELLNSVRSYYLLLSNMVSYDMHMTTNLKTYNQIIIILTLNYVQITCRDGARIR